MIGPIEASEIESLSPMPASVGRLASLVCDPNVSMDQVAEVVEFDQALTANVLKLANSAWSGVQNPIEAIRDAVVRIGAGRLLEMLVGRRVSGVMKAACEGYELAEHELWRHSVAAALAAEHLGKFASVPIPAGAFTAALTHDIGKLLLTRHFGPDAVDEIRRLMAGESVLYVEAERATLGVDHAQVGGEVAKHWHFPDTLVVAIAGHHDPDVDPNPMLDAVHVSNLAAKLIGVGLGAEQLNVKGSQDAPERLGLNPRSIEAICARVATDLAKAEKAFGGQDNGD